MLEQFKTYPRLLDLNSDKPLEIQLDVVDDQILIEVMVGEMSSLNMVQAKFFADHLAGASQAILGSHRDYMEL
jgi:hypothetical protein